MNNLTRNILIGAAAGLVAAWIKSKTEPVLQEAGEKIFPPTAEEMRLKGADVKRLPENMPQAVLANNAYQAVMGKPLKRRPRIKAKKVINFATGALVGIVYTCAVNPIKYLRNNAAGVMTGAAVWGMTHGSLLPRTGLQAPVKKMPKAWWIWEFGSHIVYGVSLDTGRRVLTKIFRKKKKKKTQPKKIQPSSLSK